MEAAVDRSEASALADLQMHWDEAYAIGLDGDIWSARFHGSADELRAHTSTELRQLIRADYAYRQQASRVRATAAGAGLTGPGAPDLDDADLDDVDLDDDDYAAHFDGANVDNARPETDPATGGGHQHDAQPDRQAESSQPAKPAQPFSSYADLRGERMST
jgi:hypothetical protein